MIKKLFRLLRSQLLRFDYSLEELVRQRGGVIGENVFIGQDVHIDLDYAFLLEVGDGAVISAKSMIEMHDSSLPNVEGKGKMKVGRVMIGKRSYIGVNTVILPGIRIGDGAIIGASSLVNKNIPAREVWAGNPARLICTVDELAQKRDATGDHSHEFAHFEWIGEPEKRGIDYEQVKKEFLSNMKRYFIK